MSKRKGGELTKVGEGIPKTEGGRLTMECIANLLGLDRSYTRRVTFGATPDTCIVHRVSPVTGKWNSININVPALLVEEYYSGLNGGLIQDVFPSLSSTEREFIMTGMTTSDWSDTFAADGDE